MTIRTPLDDLAGGRYQKPYFGEPWDAPMLDPYDDGHPAAVQVPTPVGQRCTSCNEKVVDGDRGMMRGCLIRRNAAGELVPTVEPVHVECDLLEMTGHLVGVCPCRPGYSERTPRENALAALAATDALRARSGMLPLFTRTRSESAP